MSARNRVFFSEHDLPTVDTWVDEHNMIHIDAQPLGGTLDGRVSEQLVDCLISKQTGRVYGEEEKDTKGSSWRYSPGQR